MVHSDPKVTFLDTRGDALCLLTLMLRTVILLA